MMEKVNPSHPDKVADRIAGALVDLAYEKEENPIIAVEGLLGHDECNIIIETNVNITFDEISKIVKRITNNDKLKENYKIVRQDTILNTNQLGSIKCGDNGIFKGSVLTKEEKEVSRLARIIYSKFPTDGKYILDNNNFIICQSNATNEEIKELLKNENLELKINPLGYWTGGINVDTGAVNRKLGSDMGKSITGGGIHGKDLSKADVSINIYAFLKAQETNKEVNICCAIGDVYVDDEPYSEIVNIAKSYIQSIGGFENLAKWGLY